MLYRFTAALSICLSSFFTTCAQAEKPDLRKEEGARKIKVSAALVKGYKVLASAVQNYPEHRKCFSCHHQTLPLLAFSLRDSNLPRSIQFTNSVGTRGIIDFTTASFETKRPQLLDGTKFDGGALAVGYGLWTMEIARAKPNETTNAMVLLIDDQTASRYKGRIGGLSWEARNAAIDFLLRTQEEDGSWHVASRAVPIRTFFDNGDPHGKDQFISVMATSWAVAALASHRGDHREPMDDSRSGPITSKPKSKGSLSSLLK